MLWQRKATNVPTFCVQVCNRKTQISEELVDDNEFTESVADIK